MFVKVRFAIQRIDILDMKDKNTAFISIYGIKEGSRVSLNERLFLYLGVWRVKYCTYCEIRFD